MAKLRITGNLTPQQWYKAISFENGKPDPIAVALLSEIVYWYRPREVRDEATGAFLRFERRFASDKLQRSYASFADEFGFTKRQVSAAIHRLVELKLIDLDFRTIITKSGTKLGNVLYIGLNVDALEAITYQDTPYHTRTLEVSRSSVIPSHVETQYPVTSERGTNTETTDTETTYRERKKGASEAPISPQFSMDVFDPEQSTDFSSEVDLLLKSTLAEEAKAIRVGRTGHRRGPRTFETMAQKVAWRAATDIIVTLGGMDELHKALQWALKNGRKSRGRIVSTMETWAKNLQDPQTNWSGRESNLMNADEYAAWAEQNQPETVPLTETTGET
jgi:hypothetical protein